jgi:hypothetical protein
LSWQTNRIIEDIRCAEGVAVEQPCDTLDPNGLFGFDTNALFGDTSVLFNTSLPGYQCVDVSFDYGSLTMSKSESQCSFPPTVRETADEDVAHDSQSSFYSNLLIADGFYPIEETALYLPSTPSKVPSISAKRSSRQSSSSQSIDLLSEDVPVGKIRISKHSVSRRRHISSRKSFACMTCSKGFKHEKDLTRHQHSSCGAKDRLFVCTCNKDYKRKDGLLRHIKTRNTIEQTNRHKIKDLLPTPTLP